MKHTIGYKILRDFANEINQLFNATSLREATKGMALNKAIYVFTVVTVAYTPIGFLAVSNNIGLSFLDNIDGLTPL